MLINLIWLKVFFDLIMMVMKMKMILVMMMINQNFLDNNVMMIQCTLNRVCLSSLLLYLSMVLVLKVQILMAMMEMMKLILVYWPHDVIVDMLMVYIYKLIW